MAGKSLKGTKSHDAALRGRGLRLTGPRRVILEVLRGTESHPTAEWVYRLVRRRLPSVSLGT
ncbi:MAG: ferric-uptake regulator, partial [Candidatus Rokubacteria bacterium]|nr:ferric-uptake regulator [Candidatus Rokubacteria bacterium]